MNIRERLLGRYLVADNPLRTERLFELFLLLVAVALVVQFTLSIVLVFRTPSIPSVAPAIDAITPVIGKAPGIPLAEQSLEIESRPLFWASRRPVTEVQQASGSGPGREKPKQTGTKAKYLKGMKLVGVFAQEREGVALIVRGDKRFRLTVGAEFEGWELASIDSSGAEFRSGAEVQRLEIQRTNLPVGSDGAETVTPLPDVDPKEAAKARAEREKANNTLTFGGG